VNSGIRRIGICTQYRARSLIRHVQRGWSFLEGRFGEFVELLPAQQQERAEWYKGTADAVFQNVDLIARYAPKFVLVLAGDHIYKMDYSKMLEEHVAMGAKMSVASIDVPREDATQLGVIAVDEKGRITGFVEKPKEPPTIPGRPDRSLGSMGVYVFDAKFLFEELQKDANDPTSSHDFGKDIIPRLVRQGQASAHPFDQSCVVAAAGGEPYWRDVGTIDAYWDANIDLTATVPALDLYDTRWPIWTYQPQLPPAKFVHNEEDRRGMAIESLVSGGCIVSGSVFHSVLFSVVRVHSRASVNWTVALPGAQIGRDARLTRVVIDRGCVIPDGMVIGEDAADDERRFYRSENGITLVTRDMLAKLA
jgi:glucose-1-phosphate adenylyltransferase